MHLPARSKTLVAAVAAALASSAFLRFEPATDPPPAAPSPSPSTSTTAPEPEPEPSVASARTAEQRRTRPTPEVRARPVVAVTAERQRARTTVAEPAAEPRSRNPLEQHYPKQFRARQDLARPATAHWALIIGIDDYAGGTTDTIGSVNDAKALRAFLLAQGWRSDHILLLLDRRATAANIVHAIRWLRSKADRDSVVVFHYSGHEKPTRTRADGDDEARDVALWAADNRLVVDGDLGRELGRVRAARMWIDIAACRAGGFDDAGMRGENRVITYSSPERELSYEDPEVGHSVFGYHTIAMGMREGFADRNDDGDVTVEEAFSYAKPRVREHTSDRQHSLIVDGYAGSFSLKVPPAPKPSPEPEGSPTPCTIGVVCRP